MYKVNLKESLIQALDFVKVGDYELAFADGEVKIDFQESSLPILQMAPAEAVKGLFWLASSYFRLGAHSLRVLCSGHPAVFLGELKFTDLKRLLNANGVQASHTINQPASLCLAV